MPGRGPAGGRIRMQAARGGGVWTAAGGQAECKRGEAAAAGAMRRRGGPALPQGSGTVPAASSRRGSGRAGAASQRPRPAANARERRTCGNLAAARCRRRLPLH